MANRIQEDLRGGKVSLHNWSVARSAMPGLPKDVGPTWLDAQFLYDHLDRGPRTGDAKTDVELVELVHWRARWVQDGSPTFQLTHGLEAALVMTDCSGVKWVDFKLPFDSIMITLAHPNNLINITGMDGVTVMPARWIIVHTALTGESLADGEAMNAAYEHASRRMLLGDRGPMSDLVRSVRSRAGARRRLLYRLVAEDGTSIFSTCYVGADEDTIDEWFHPTGKRGGALGVDLDRHASEAASRLVVNLCLYIAGLRADGQWSPRPPKTQRDGADPSATTYVVGREIKLSPQVRESARAWCEQGRNKAAWRVRSRSMVRGHWRNQAHGQGMLLRRKKWILPHWRGPEGGPELARMYRVGTGAEADVEGAGETREAEHEQHAD